MTIEKLVLHHHPATRSIRARWALLETVGEDFEIKRLNLYAGEQYAPDYLAQNPNHNVPMLDIHWSDGSVQHMLESAAMVLWLADGHPEKRLAPAPETSRERADFLQIFQFGVGWMDMMLWQVRAQVHLLRDDLKDPATEERYRRKMADEAEPQLKARLERHSYIAGDVFSAADIVIGYNIFWARGYGMCEDEIFGAYFDRLQSETRLSEALDDIGDFQLALPDEVRAMGRFAG